MTDPRLPQLLSRLRFRDEDAADALEVIAVTAADPSLVEIVTRYANRLIDKIGDFSQHPEVWDDVPAPRHLPAGTLPMLALLASADEVASWHRERGIDEDASDAALADLGQQVFVHRLAYGAFGLHAHGWLTWAWSGALYWLGRLQFNLQRTQIPGHDGPQWVLSTHIPRLGPLDDASVDDAFERARTFFAQHFPQYEVGFFYCDSWLLDPTLSEVMSDSNLAKFQRRWHRFGEAKPGNADVLLFVFDRRPDSPTSGHPLPSTTSLHREAARKLNSGDQWVVPQGVIPLNQTIDVEPAGGSEQPQLAGQILGTLLPGFEGTTLPEWLAALLRRGLAGVCLFGQNIQSTAQTRRLTDAVYAANPHAIVAIDEEGGDVTRLHHQAGSPYPGNAVLGRLDDLAATRASGAEVGRALRAVGVNVNFAPCVDVNSNPDNPVIGVRSFGTVPALVAAHGAAWIEGLQTVGVAATAKHFPGHGDTDADSHLALPRVDRSLVELAERELVPFAAAVGAGAKLVMTSHISLPQLDPERPATMSPAILELLRSDLGFDGVIVTDALDMAGAQAGLDPNGTPGLPGAALAALSAGCDLLCLGTENTPEQVAQIVEVLTRAVDEDQLGPPRVSEAANRVRRLSEGLGAEQHHPGTPEWSGVVDEELIMSTFDRLPGTTVPRLGEATVIRIEANASLAIGRTPWAPALDEAGEHLVLDLDTPEPPRIERGRPIIVLGRNVHRNAAATKIIDALRASHDRVFVVDMGWPSQDRRYADLATFGASARVSSAVKRYLQQQQEER